MIKNDKLKKIVYFLIPNLLYVTLFSYFYNRTISYLGDSFEILFSHVLILSGIYFVMFSFIYFILRIKIDCIRTFFIMISLILLSFELIYKSWVLWILIILVNVLIFRMKDETREKFLYFFTYVIVMLFLMNIFTSTKYYFTTINKYIKIDEKVKYNIDEDIQEKPNIYWIHCDGMINLADAKKYFNFDNDEFEKYLQKTGFYLNKEAELFSSGHTIQALVSMFNPKYYDSVFHEYLMNIKNGETNYGIVSYDDMTEKRMNNELFGAFSEVDYKFAVISDYNQYASFYGDYMFDYYDFQKANIKDLNYFTALNNSNEDIRKYNDYAHFKTLLDTTFLHYFTDDYSFLDYEEINYNVYNFDKYKNIASSDYFKSKAILKSLDIVYNTNKDNKLFTFIDYGINHTPWLYDKNGKVVNTNKEGFLLKNFVDNYEHSTLLLIDMLEYIKDNDPNSVIILQSDHGIHTVSTNLLVSKVDNSEKKDLVSSTFSSIYIPEEYKNGEEEYLNNPLNISRYLVNNYVGKNYDYIKE